MTEMATQAKNKWQEIKRQQALANSRRWLTLLESEPDPGLFLNENYENILKALELLLTDETDLELSLTLMKIIARFIFNYGDWERWAVYVQKALTYTQSTEQLENQGFLLMQMGHILYSRGNWDAAANYFQQAGSIYQQINMPASYANALGRWGYVQSHRGQISEGVALCQEALAIATEAQAEQVIAETQASLAQIYLNAHEWENALVAAQAAYRYYEPQKSDANRHNLINLIVTLSGKLGRWAEVASLAHRYMDSLEQAGEVRKLARIKMNLGVIFFEQGEYKAAESLWYEALQLQSQIQEPRSQAILYNNLGHLYTQLDEWETAETMLKEAIQIYAKLGDVYYQADTLDNLAECYQRQNKMSACRRSLEEAISLLEQSDTSAPYYQELLQKLKNNLIQLLSTDLQAVSR